MKIESNVRVGGLKGKGLLQSLLPLTKKKTKQKNQQISALEEQNYIQLSNSSTWMDARLQQNPIPVSHGLKAARSQRNCF